MFKLLGTFVSRYWALVIAGWVTLAVGFLVLTSDGMLGMTWKRMLPKWDEITHDGDLAYLPDRMTTVRGAHLLEKAFPDSKSKSQIALVFAREDGKLTEADRDVYRKLSDLTRIKEIYAELAKHEYKKPEELVFPIVQQQIGPNEEPAEGAQAGQAANIEDVVWTPDSKGIGKKLNSADGHAALMAIHLRTEFMAVQNMTVLDSVTAAIDEVRKQPNFPAGLQIGVTGSGAVGGDMLASARDSISKIDLYSVVLVAFILMVVYRAPMLVLIPITTILISVIVAMNVVSLLTMAHTVPGLEWVDFKVFKTTKIFIVTLLFGAGTDFCLFLISRYKEELQLGLPRREALAAALGNVGDAITASAFTTIFGLSMMFFADFGKFRNSGPAIGLCLAVAWIACITLAPAMLRLFAPVVFWPFNASVQPVAANATPKTSRFWEGLSYAIIRRPGLILIGSIVLLSGLAVEGWDVPISYNLLGELDNSRPSVVGTKLLEQHYSPGEVGPMTILAYNPDARFELDRPALPEATLEGAPAAAATPTPLTQVQIAELTKSFYDIDGVTSVRSITEPLGNKPASLLGRKLSMSEKTEAKTMSRNPRVRKTYLSPEMVGQVARFDVAVKYDPFSHEAAQALEQIDTKLASMGADKNSPWYGTTFDFIGTTAGTRDLESVTTSDQTLIQRLVVLSVMGVLVMILRRPFISVYLIFSVLFSYYVTIGETELFFSHLYQPFDGLDWKVPIFLFVILIAVGQDYNIFLAHRVFEEQKHHKPLEGLRVAVVQTGGIITSCGVIMAGTFCSMLTGTLKGMLEMGFALTLGVMLDTFIVRPVLVPAFLAIVFRWQERRDERRQAEPTSTAPSSEAPMLPHQRTVNLSAERSRRAAS